MTDLRPLLFAGAEWYERLAPPTDDAPSAWFVAKETGWWAGELLSASAAFAREHDLLDAFRLKFRGIEPQELLPERAVAKRRSVSSPIWVIAHELVVARYLERVLRWSLVSYEPPGHQGRRGDWQFTTPSGQAVFVEVKTLEEPDHYGSTGVYSRPVRVDRIRDVVKGAYKQLPDDDRATLVVIAGREILSVSHGILFSDIGQTMFGQFQVRFTPMVEDPNVHAGPAFRDMMVHGTKHRRIGCLAGLRLSGMALPYVYFYAVDNPYASPGKRLNEADLVSARRLIVDDDGHGEEKPGLTLEETWERMAVS